MFEDVAMDHVGKRFRRTERKRDQDLRRAARLDRNGVLPASQPGRNRSFSKAQDAELAAMDMDRMQHLVGAFADQPSQRTSARHLHPLHLQREGHTVDPIGGKLFALRQSRIIDKALRQLSNQGGVCRLVQADLAKTLSLISAKGPDAFYRGPIGAAIADASAKGGGILTRADFAGYKVRELKPVECDYRGYHVISAPPPSSAGVSICEALNMLGGYDLAAMGFHSADQIHVMAEVLRRVYVDRNNKLGDPAFVNNPVSELLDPAYAAKLRAGIDPQKATPSSALGPAAAPAEGHNTTHFSVADAKGNAVAVTYTLNGWFGTHRVAGNTGILMNNEMDDFAAKPGVPNMYGLVEGTANAIAPGKTPLSSMSPTILTKNGKVAAVIGSPGGSTIITTTLQAIVNMIDYGMDVQEAINAPRIHEQWMPDTIMLEPYTLSPDTRRILEGRGYNFTDSSVWGIAEGIVVGEGPRLSPAPKTSGSLLMMSDKPLKGATMFGAHDARSGAGAAVPVH